MASSSSSSYSYMRPQEKYAVFVSFRGLDTRDNFTSHLYEALCRKKVHTFIDDRLERGDEISPALVKVIKEAMLSVIIFSENYASSTWCLDELVQILECREKGQIVIPVFCRLDPSHVRKQKGSYAVAFTKLEERFQNRMNKVHQWRAALTEAANLSGWDSLVTKPESKLIEGIVKDILKKLNYKLSISEVKGLVGIEERIKKIKSLLRMDSPDVRVVGIWGMGGIGNTTLAGAVLNQLSYQFERCWRRIRKTWNKSFKRQAFF
nr:disease resistance protein Roq1-like [Ziziphus jujuba var. spinosa]